MSFANNFVAFLHLFTDLTCVLIPHMLSFLQIYSENNQITPLPSEIGLMTSLTKLDLGEFQKYFVAFLNLFTDLTCVLLHHMLSFLQIFSAKNQITSVASEIGQLTSLTYFYLGEYLKLFCGISQSI